MKLALGAEGGDGPAAPESCLLPRDRVFLIQAQNETAPGPGDSAQDPRQRVEWQTSSSARCSVFGTLVTAVGTALVIPAPPLEPRHAGHGAFLVHGSPPGTRNGA